MRSLSDPVRILLLLLFQTRSTEPIDLCGIDLAASPLDRISRPLHGVVQYCFNPLFDEESRGISATFPKRRGRDMRRLKRRRVKNSLLEFELDCHMRDISPLWAAKSALKVGSLDPKTVKTAALYSASFLQDTRRQ